MRSTIRSKARHIWPDRVHTVKDPPGPESVLRRAVSGADPAEHVGCGNPDVVVANLAVVRLRLGPKFDAADH